MSEPHSTNERAERTMGRRQVHGIILDQPCELDYHCPVCEYENVIDGSFDERLEWSEYESFLWCSVCNRDYPSALCRLDISKAIDVFLSSVEDAMAAPQAENTRLRQTMEDAARAIVNDCELAARDMLDAALAELEKP